jgi:hypothetical protein
MNEAHRQRQLAHIRDCIAEIDRPKSAEEIERAIECAQVWNRELEGRREPEQQRLNLAA